VIAAHNGHIKPAACRSGSYKNSSGNCVEDPDGNTSGGTARCADGTESHSQHRSGTCSGHGGVSQWNGWKPAHSGKSAQLAAFTAGIFAPTPAPPLAPSNCSPHTNSGRCYEPGEFCRSSDHGASGVAGDGENIVCQNNDGWRWEPAS
jgi:hypothetical protein